MFEDYPALADLFALYGRLREMAKAEAQIEYLRKLSEIDTAFFNSNEKVAELREKLKSQLVYHTGSRRPICNALPCTFPADYRIHGDSAISSYCEFHTILALVNAQVAKTPINMMYVYRLTSTEDEQGGKS